MYHVNSNGSVKSNSLEDTDAPGNYGWLVEGWSALWSLSDDSIEDAIRVSIECGPYAAYEAEYDELDNPSVGFLSFADYLAKTDSGAALAHVLTVRDENIEERFTELGYKAAETDYTDSSDAYEAEDTHRTLQQDQQEIAADAFGTGWQRSYDESSLSDVMTAAETATAFGLAEATVRQAINRGQINARKSSGTWLVLRKDVEKKWGGLRL